MSAMTVAIPKRLPASTALEADPASSPGRNPAVAGFLDHLAEELAREYVRLTEEAAKDGRPADRGARDEEG
jgi:hypothetical protein